jgi:enamine deaminase RidA (YjgF/YER057c/UK114 family)
MAIRELWLAATLIVVGAAPAFAKQCYAPDARSQSRGYSRAVTVDGGKTMWLGGQYGTPNNSFDSQVRETFTELDKTIRAQGGAGLADMVTMTVFINDGRLGDRFIELRKEFFKECFPASTLITVTGFAQPGLLIEIEGTAVLGGK